MCVCVTPMFLVCHVLVEYMWLHVIHSSKKSTNYVYTTHTAKKPITHTHTHSYTHTHTYTHAQVLMVSSRNYSGEWTLPGGGLEPGETARQTAIREALEEVLVHTNDFIVQLLVRG